MVVDKVELQAKGITFPTSLVISPSGNGNGNIHNGIGIGINSIVPTTFNYQY